jgi:hypothetical protein
MIDTVLHKVLTHIEYRAVSGVFRTIDPPTPLNPASVSPGGEGVGGGGQYFGRRQPLDWPLTVSSLYAVLYLALQQQIKLIK